MNREFTISNLPFYVQLHESENQAIMHEATWERGGLMPGQMGKVASE